MHRPPRSGSLRSLFCLRTLVCVTTLAFATPFLVAPAHAGAATAGAITFGPASSSVEAVPALGTTMAVLLALLLAFMALVTLKRRAGTLSAAGALIATGVLLGTLGMPLVDRAVGAGMTFFITQSGGQTLDITPNDINIYQNTSGLPVRVLSVTLPETCLASEAIDEPFECRIGRTVEDSENCVVDCTLPVLELSDLRLKEEVVQIGITPNGLPLYRFRYVGGSDVYEGVMAQDVLSRFPEAVVQREDGYLAVNYSLLGLTLRRIAP